MRLWNLVVAQVRSLRLRGRRQQELDEELRLHLEQEIAQHVVRGMSATEARRTTLRTFGRVEKVKDECRDAWGLRLVDELARDTRYATRRLVRDWRFSLLAMSSGASQGGPFQSRRRPPNGATSCSWPVSWPPWAWPPRSSPRGAPPGPIPSWRCAICKPESQRFGDRLPTRSGRRGRSGC